jgi:Secretion system C-terminal sorting domain
LWYRLNKAAEAETYYRTLIAKYPKDPLAISAMATLGESPAIDQPSKASVAEIAPTEYSVDDPYPNPFNPSTQINFALPETGNLSLIVYDVLGRQVATLARDLYTAGKHSVKWDGASSASGIYYARLCVTNEIGSVLFSKVIKLLLTKKIYQLSLHRARWSNLSGACILCEPFPFHALPYSAFSLWSAPGLSVGF